MKIIRQYKFKQLPTDSNKLIDILPSIYQRDIAILESWEKDFRSRGIPFFVTASGSLFKLWKERRINFRGRLISMPRYRQEEGNNGQSGNI